jgi:hypothetical protein
MYNVQLADVFRKKMKEYLKAKIKEQNDKKY